MRRPRNSRRVPIPWIGPRDLRPADHELGDAFEPATPVNGGSRLHLRDDWPRTPSGPEGSSGRGFKSGAEVLLARAASLLRLGPRCYAAKLAPMSYIVLARKWRPKRFCRNGGSGARAAGAGQRPRHRQGPSCVPVHRHARRGQDHGRADPREVPELRDRRQRPIPAACAPPAGRSTKGASSI